ncbi:hypothetical protein CAEBREN_23738 [Caenorhabditis brenneri]|uniref:CRAL-TRIO domain-containing protein n=1 Tax=Caenorhabditis brenneri TaxID=135651 RepID=G0PLF0_CAEBE|nr:hypothetical protein CAEBREN_23738 [Caenorhabditis brenneri]
MTMKAEDIMHVLRDGIAVLPGGRCRAGQAVVVCPSREQVVNPDHLRNVFLYLFEVTAKESREKGFLVVIDMRGKQTWNNVRNILKVLNIANRILHPSNGFKNPDLLATTPYISNLTDSLRLLKGEVHKNWDSRQVELMRVYQQKLFECDAEKMIEALRPYKHKFERSMGDVGGCVGDVSALAADFEQFETAVMIENVTDKLAKEWTLVKELIERRKAVLQNARRFFTSAQCYFAEVPRWTAQPGINPDDVRFNQECLENAIRAHDKFWANVEEVYAQAYEDALNLMKALKEAETEDNVAKEHSSRLQRAHKQLGERWKERQVLLHQMLAMIAFETDVKLVVDWLEQHGEPYLRRNINIGENVNQAKTFQRNHTSFQRVAANTYNNVEKLGQVFQDVTNAGSNICDVEKMSALMTDLTAKIEKFTALEQLREQLLRQSVLFHTHYKELTDWYRKMTEKYRDRRIDLTVQVCDQNKERFVLETDETAQAYAVTIGEGKAVIDTMQKSTRLIGVDYTASITHIQLLIADIGEWNIHLIANFFSLFFKL